MNVFRIYAKLNNLVEKTYLSGAPTVYEAVKALEAMMKPQDYAFRVVKVERVMIP